MISTKNQAGADVLDPAMLEPLSLAPREISWNCNRHKPQPNEGTVPTPKTGEGAKLCMGWAGFRLRGNALMSVRALGTVTLRGLIYSDTIKMHVVKRIIHLVPLSKSSIRSF